MMYQQDSLSQFSRQTPRILRRQLILQLTDQYLGRERSPPEKHANSCMPSIQRFNGALLYAEITGLSDLSASLGAVELKHHIDEYFSKLMEIVDRHGGDVVKIAGDVMFIAWEENSADVEEGQASREALLKSTVAKATTCAQEIALSCCGHRVAVSNDVDNHPASGKSPNSVAHGSRSSSRSVSPIPLNSLPVSATTGTRQRASPLPATSDGDMGFLNIRVAISSGLMAGIDVGSDNRWEYFLIGEPLSKVAEAAEGVGASGEVVLCGDSHALLHPGAGAAKISRLLKTVKSALLGGPASDGVKLSCGCTQQQGGYCTLASAPAGPIERAKGHSSPHFTDDSSSACLTPTGQRLLTSLSADVDAAYSAHGEQFAQEAARLQRNMGFAVSDIADLSATRMQPAFAEWVLTCLTDDLARHVHPVVRGDHTFSAVHTTRQGAYQRAVEEQVKAQTPLLSCALETARLWSPGSSRPTSPLAPLSPLALPSGTLTAAVTPISISKTKVKTPPGPLSPLNLSSFKNLTVNVMEETATPRLSPSPSMDFPNRSGSGGDSLTPRRGVSSAHPPTLGHWTRPLSTKASAAEMRPVSIVTVKIDLPDVDLLVDGTRRQRSGGGGHFLSRTVNEAYADQLLLNRFQMILEGVSDVFARFGGVVKSFAVEDSVVLCSGTFGLRGSLSSDTAGPAIDAARSVKDCLLAEGLECHVGVTLGRTFCGPVGSHSRHEYSVMGLAVRHGAQLVQRAPSGFVVCDLETRQRDKTHGFLSLDEDAGTFVPIFAEASRERVDSLHVPSVNASPASDCHRKSFTGVVGGSTASTLILRQLLRTKDLHFGGLAVGDRHRQLLHGRDREFRDLVEFLFTPLVTGASASKVNTSPTGGVIDPAFDHLLPSRCAGVTGSFGIGKTSLLSSIVERLAVVARCNEGCNVHLFKGRLDSFHHDSPFAAWKPIIVAMLVRLYRSRDVAKRHRNSFVVGTVTASQELVSSVDHVMSLLPTSLANFKPLFTFMGVLPHDDSLHDLKLNLTQKYAHCTELLVALIQLYSSVTRSLAVLVLDNIHSIDRPSLRLLVEVCSDTKGVVVLFACRSAGPKDLGPRLALRELSGALYYTDRYMSMELSELDRAPISKLIADVFRMQRSSKVTADTVALCDKVFESSGGNPFYAYEIAKSASEHQNQTWDASLTAVHSIRVEEVICHRFDQLRGSAQSLLKMAAVACSNGAAVTLQLLNAMDDTNLTIDSGVLNCEELAEELHNLLATESFLRVVGLADPLIEVTVEKILSGRLSFEFSIPLEQSTIYGLLMEDQKHAMHETVAIYLSAFGEDNDEEEEAHHWQGACVFGRAMTCYFRAYQAEGDAERRSGWLSRAYGIYLHRKENTELVPDPTGLTLEQLTALFEGSVPAGLTQERVFHIFEEDADLLNTGLEMLLAVAEERTARSEDSITTQLLLEDAMQFSLLTRVEGEEHFHYRSRWAMCFRVLSAYVLCDAQSSHVSVEYFRKVGFVAARWVELARGEKHSRHHAVHALGVQCLLLFKMGLPEKAAGVVAELRALYCSDAHSALMTETYGYDIVPLALRTAGSLDRSSGLGQAWVVGGNQTTM